MNESSREPSPPLRQRIDQFLAAVDRALAGAGISGRERRGVTDDLREQILEMLAARTAEAPTADDLEAVLAELDPPESYAGDTDAGDTATGEADTGEADTGDTATGDADTGEPAAAQAEPRPRREHAAAGSPGGGSTGRCAPGRGTCGGPRHHRHPHGGMVAYALRRVFSRRGPGGAPLFARFTEPARQSMMLAKAEARRLDHDYIGTEHILLGLVREEGGIAAQVLKTLHVDLEKARAAVASLVKPGDRPSDAPRLPLTPRARQSIGAAFAAARELRSGRVGTEHLLLGQLAIADAVAAQALMKLGLTAESVRDAVKAALADAERSSASAVASAPAAALAPAPLIHWPAGTGKVVAFAGEIYSFIATSSDTADACSMFELTVPPRSGPPLHVHRNEDEAFYVIEGELRFRVGDRTLTVGPGGFISLPRGVAHSHENLSPTPARAVIVATPGGIDRAYSEAGIPLASKSAPLPAPDIESLRAPAARFGIEFPTEKKTRA